MDRRYDYLAGTFLSTGAPFSTLYYNIDGGFPCSPGVEIMLTTPQALHLMFPLPTQSFSTFLKPTCGKYIEKSMPRRNYDRL